MACVSPLLRKLPWRSALPPPLRNISWRPIRTCKTESALALPPEKRNCMNSPAYLVKGCNYSLHYRGGDKSRIGEKQHHCILFKDETFTVEGGPYRSVQDSENFPFLKSLEKRKIPHEFGGGYHEICVLRRCDKGWEDIFDDKPLVYTLEDIVHLHLHVKNLIHAMRRRWGTYKVWQTK